MNTEFVRFAASSGLAAIDRYYGALGAGSWEAASAALAEWLFWWRSADEAVDGASANQLGKELHAALVLARNGSTHRKFTASVMHSSRVGEMRIGVTTLGQTERVHSWMHVDAVPTDDRELGRRARENEEAQRRSYREELSAKPSHLAADRVADWLRSLLETTDRAARRNPSHQTQNPQGKDEINSS